MGIAKPASVTDKYAHRAIRPSVMHATTRHPGASFTASKQLRDAASMPLLLGSWAVSSTASTSSLSRPGFVPTANPESVADQPSPYKSARNKATLLLDAN